MNSKMCTSLQIKCKCLDENTFVFTHIHSEKEERFEIEDKPPNVNFDATKSTVDKEGLPHDSLN